MTDVTRNLLKLCGCYATQVFANPMHLGRTIWLPLKVGNRIHASDQQTHYLKCKITTTVQTKGHKCIYLSAEAPWESYDFQELVLPMENEPLSEKWKRLTHKGETRLAK